MIRAPVPRGVSLDDHKQLRSFFKWYKEQFIKSSAIWKPKPPRHF
jgi:hypothetical protein